jgi:hypothetical protein
VTSRQSLRDRLAKLFACQCDPAWTERRLHAPNCVKELGDDALEQVAEWLRDEIASLGAERKRDLDRTDGGDRQFRIDTAMQMLAIKRLADSISPQGEPKESGS